MTKSMSGMVMMMKIGFRFEIMSLGTPPRVIVEAWEVKLPVIWL